MSQPISDASDRLSQAGSNAQQEAQQAFDGLEANLGSLKDEVAKAVEDSGTETPSSRHGRARSDGMLRSDMVIREHEPRLLPFVSRSRA